AGAGDYLAAVTGYERALREAPDFPDAARGRFMLGQANLLLGFGPEAGAAFADLVRHDPQSPLAGDARLGQAAALRLRRRPTEARRLLDAVLAEASGALLCRARGEEVAEARAAGSPAEAARAYRRLVAVCPAALQDPVTRGDYAEALAAAGDTAERAGRFEEALGLLERAATLGPEGAAQADGRRAEILGRWVAALGGADDAAGVAAVYAAYATDIDAAAAPEDALAIARALGRLGLHP